MTSSVTPPPGKKPVAMVKPCLRLLVVGDQPTCKHTLSEIFHRDHDILAAGNGVQAFEICRNSLPELILLDVVMPGTNGLEVCRQLKTDPDTMGIPVILLIAQDSPEDETKALAGIESILSLRRAWLYEQCFFMIWAD